MSRTFFLDGDAPDHRVPGRQSRPTRGHESIVAGVRAAIERAGYRAVDVLAPDLALDLAINISMPSLEDVQALDVLDEEAFDRITRALLGRCFQRMKEELPLVAKSGGAIVNVVSMLALEGRTGCAAIAASEHAIIGLTQSAARTYAGRARVNALCVSRHFANNEEEIARAVLALAAPGLRGLSGQAIVLDAGLGAY